MIGLLFKPFTFVIKLVVTSGVKAVFYGALAAAPLAGLYLGYKYVTERKSADGSMAHG
jgi:hypothetical protein